MLLATSCMACTSHPPTGSDSWAVRRDFDREPGVTSISQINLDAAVATTPVDPVVLRQRMRDRWHLVLLVDAPLVKTWSASPGLLDRELDAALEWLQRIASNEHREVKLQVTLVDRSTQRHEKRRHPATSALVVDLLVPADVAPSSYSAAAAKAMALALHEAAHVLRNKNDRDRAGDEYRASLVEACYLLDVARSGDVLRFAVAPTPADPDFVRRHSRDAAARVMTDLLRVAGRDNLPANDRAVLQRLRDFCRRKTIPAKLKS